MSRLSRIAIAAAISLGSILMLYSATSFGGTGKAEATKVAGVKNETKPKADSDLKKHAKKVLPVREMGGY